jgi:intracellular septation protein A
VTTPLVVLLALETLEVVVIAAEVVVIAAEVVMTAAVLVISENVTAALDASAAVVSSAVVTAGAITILFSDRRSVQEVAVASFAASEQLTWAEEGQRRLLAVGQL